MPSSSRFTVISSLYVSTVLVFCSQTHSTPHSVLPAHLLVIMPHPYLMASRDLWVSSITAMPKNAQTTTQLHSGSLPLEPPGKVGGSWVYSLGCYRGTSCTCGDGLSDPRDLLGYCQIAWGGGKWGVAPKLCGGLLDF